MNSRLFKLSFFVLLSVLFFPTKLLLAEDVCENNEIQETGKRGLFWSDTNNKPTQTVDIKVLVGVIDKILELTNRSLKLKITSDAFKLTLKDLGDQVKKIDMDLKSKDKLQKTITSLVDYLSEYSKATPPDIISLSKILDKLSLPSKNSFKENLK